MAKKSYRPKGPSKTDLASEAIEEEMVEFWKSIADSDLKGWDKPWIENVFSAENAGKYVNKGERYEYQGGFNQFLVAYQTQLKDAEKGPLVFNRTDLTEIFEAESFKDTPIVKNGIKSAGSLYKAPIFKTTWTEPSGQVWRPEGKPRQPSTQEKADLGLKENKSKPMYGTFPVWSADDIYDKLPSEAQTKIDKLIELRKPESSLDINIKNADWNKVVNEKIYEIIDRQGIKATEGGNKAFYVPTEDRISVPTEGQFSNPIERLATVFHELAHSTKHITGRLPVNRALNDKAKEELLAETSAVLMVRRFEKEVAPFIEKDEKLASFFDDYYENSRNYNHMWGESLDFDGIIDNIEEQRKSNKSVVKVLMVNISKAVNTLENGEYTPEQRHEAKVTNFSRDHSPGIEQKQDSKLSLSI